MKKSMMIAMSALALVGCQTDEVLDSHSGSEQSANTAIRFDGGAGKITRALSGDEAATALNKNFVVYGYKTTGETKSVVYDHYNVNWLGKNTGTHSESNTAGWEYVGQPINSLNSVSGSSQTIKYWDYSASQYDFVAFSFGTAVQGRDVTASTVDQAPKYTLKGTVDNLQKCFISDRVTAEKNVTNKIINKKIGYQDAVAFNFRSLATKVKLAIYETVPGYSIKDVKYYTSGIENSTTNTVPTLYNDANTIPAGKGSMTVTFGTNDTNFNQALTEWEAEGENSSKIEWKKGLSTQGKEANESNGTAFIGRDINTKSMSDYQGVLPSDINGLTLKVDYTLESTDGSGEEIKVTGATATIPAVYTQWKPNYAYTYIFKISDKTNGSTDPSDPDKKGLYPITFDAVVTETETGKQETITTIETLSITTYAKGAVNNEYKKDQNIYVSVSGDATLLAKNETETSDEGTTTVKTYKNCNLYTVTANGYNITEANVALALTKTVNTDGNFVLSEGENKTLTVTPTSNLLNIVDKIDASDAVDGNAISGNFAKFTPQIAGTYVFEYIADAGTANAKKYYKVIIVTDNQ